MKKILAFLLIAIAFGSMGMAKQPPAESLPGCLDVYTRELYAIYKLPVDQRVAAYERFKESYPAKSKACFCQYGTESQKVNNGC